MGNLNRGRDVEMFRELVSEFRTPDKENTLEQFCALRELRRKGKGI